MITVVNGYNGQAMTTAHGFLKDYCEHCHLRIYVCDGPFYNYCARKSCVDSRKTIEQMKYIVQWETFAAETKTRRFHDAWSCYSFVKSIRGQVTDLFVIHPDGSSVEIRQ